jgi:hypothetical protein
MWCLCSMCWHVISTRTMSACVYSNFSNSWSLLLNSPHAFLLLPPQELQH